MATADNGWSGDPPPDDWSDTGAGTAWLKEQPITWSMALAARSALRITPLLLLSIDERREPGSRLSTVVLPLLRCAATSVVLGISQSSRVGKAAKAADRAVSLARKDIPALNTVATAVSSAFKFVSGDLIAYRSAVASVAYNSAAAIAAASTATNTFAIRDGPATYDGTFRYNGSFSDGSSAIYSAARADAEVLVAGSPVAAVMALPLWLDQTPARIMAVWRDLATLCREDGDHWLAWTRWYEARLYGQAWANSQGMPWIDELEFLRCTLRDDPNDPTPDETLWQAGPAAVNARILELEARYWSGHGPEPPVTGQAGDPVLDVPDDDGVHEPEVIPSAAVRVDRLATVASPHPIEDPQGRLDVEASYRPPDQDEQPALESLIDRQVAMIDAIVLSTATNNPPPALHPQLARYRHQLSAHGCRADVGVLDDAYFVAISALGDPAALGDWLPAGGEAAVTRFGELHGLLMHLFPLSQERDRVYASTSLDEERLTDPALPRLLDSAQAEVETLKEENRVTASTQEAFGEIVETLKVVRDDIMQQRVSPPADEDEAIARRNRRKRSTLNAVGFLAAVTGIVVGWQTILTHPSVASLYKTLQQLLQLLLSAL